MGAVPRIVRLTGLVGALLVALVTASATGWAASLRAAPHDGYGRLVFDWAGPVRYSTEVAAGQLIVQFNRPVEDDPRKVLGPLSEYVSAARVSQDRRTVTFPLKGPFTVNTFTLGSAVVIDLMKPTVARTADADKAAAPEEPAAQAKGPLVNVRVGEHPGFHRIVFDFTAPVRYRVERRDGAAQVVMRTPARVDAAALRAKLPTPLKGIAAERRDDDVLTVTLPIPRGGRVRHFTSGPKVVLDVLLPEEAAAPDKTPDKTRTEPPLRKPTEADAMTVPPRPAPADQAVQRGETLTGSSADRRGGDPAAPKAAGAPAADDPEAKPSAAAQALETAMREQLGRPAPQKEEPDGDAASGAASDDGGAAAEPQDTVVRSRVVSLSFSWDQSTAAAVFERAGFLWVVFDRYQELDLNLLRRLGTGVVHYIEQRQSRTATIVRMIVEPGYHPSLRREGLLWIVDLMRQPYRPPNAITVTPQPSSPVGPRLHIAATEAGKAMVLLDPEVGDKFIVVPVVPLGSGVYPARSFPDADIPVTAQGILIEPHTDRIVVNATRNGVEVTSEGGLIFSPDMAALQAMANVGKNVSFDTALDIAAWMHGTEEEFNEDKRLLQTAVANAPSSRRNPARLELARFYFAHGFAAETLGILRVMVRDDPEVLNTAAFRALRGAANVLMGRYDEAVVDFSHPSLEGIEEAAFWRAVAQSYLGDPELQALVLRDYGGVINNYPRRVKVPLAIAAARATVEAADDLATNNFLTAARATDNTPHEQAALAYIEAKQAIGIGNYDHALDLLAELSESDDRYYRAVGTRDRLELLHRLQELDKENLIKGLERLRFAWRGGDFEFNLLMRLGALYSEVGQYGEALRVWQQAATYFPEGPRTEEATKRMRETFRALYFEGLADDMPPIKAIALFDEFRHLTPDGPVGDEMIRRLADRLVSVDLLKQAAVLLQRQIDYRLGGPEKARVGTRLALVYLLDRQPSKAVETLLATKEAGLSDALERQRRHLMARALADMNRAEEAIALLEADDSREAHLLRAEIHWKNENWAGAAEALGRIVPPPSRNLVLTNDEARLVLDWATALTLSRDERGVQNLRRRYMAAMERTPFVDAFDLITTTPEEGLIDYRTVAERIKQAEDFRSFLTAYRERLRSDGLSAIN